MRKTLLVLLGALTLTTAAAPAAAGGAAPEGYPEPGGTTLCAVGNTGCVYYCVSNNTYYWYCVSPGCIVGLGAGLSRSSVIRVPLACI